MNLKDWHYLKDNNDFEKLSLNEIVQMLNEGFIGYSAKVRHQNWVYWKPIWQTPQILAHIKWDYIDQHNVLHRDLFGYELLQKALNKEITNKTPVKKADGFFVNFKDSYLMPTNEMTFSGFYASIYNIWMLIENHVIFLTFLALTLIFVLNLKPRPSKELLMIITILLDNALILLHSFFIHKKGYSLYSKLLGYNILNHDGSKLSIGKAFARHFCIKSNLEEFDQSSGIILTKQKAKDI